MRIVATVDGEEVNLDDVWVFGVDIPLSESFTFRRISSLSLKGIAIVGINVAVMCANEVVDCSETSNSTTAAESTATENTTSADTTTLPATTLTGGT